MMIRVDGVAVLIVVCTCWVSQVYGFVSVIDQLGSKQKRFVETERRTTKLWSLSPLPKGISPFEKGSVSKSFDISGEFRKKSLNALKKATKENVKLMEIEFPPLLFSGKSQFDDFDNIQELDLNRNWCVEWMTSITNTNIWFILPDFKECQLAKTEWKGDLYRKAAKWTTIEAVTQHYSSSTYSKPWGATFANSMNSLLSDAETESAKVASVLDNLNDGNPPDLHLICQPGNGGPLEDWINCEALHKAAAPQTATVIVNGALDKVRDGYYPAIFFPKLAASADRFYKPLFEPIFYLKPITDKGVYGWIYRVYPEPWQVVLQTVSSGAKTSRPQITNTVIYTSDERPSFDMARQYLLQGAAAASKK